MERLDIERWRGSDFASIMDLSEFLVACGARWRHLAADEDGRRFQHSGYDVRLCRGGCGLPTIVGHGNRDNRCGRPGCA